MKLQSNDYIHTVILLKFFFKTLCKIFHLWFVFEKKVLQILIPGDLKWLIFQMELLTYLVTVWHFPFLKIKGIWDPLLSKGPRLTYSSMQNKQIEQNKRKCN